MTPRRLRQAVIAVCAAGIAGMIAGSIADNNGTAITFGLVTAVAALGLILITAVTRPEAYEERGGAPQSFEADAEAIEQRVVALAEAGVDEEALRSLVRQAVRLGRRSARRE